MPANDPYELLTRTALNVKVDPLMVTGTLQIYDEAGVPVDYISGDVLQQVMTRVHRRVFAPIHAERRRRFDAIADWHLAPALVEPLAAAIAEPLLDAFCEDDAALLSLSCRVLRMHLCEIPSDLWWTPTVMQRLREANPAVHEHPLRMQRFVRAANYLTYQMGGNGLHPAILPLERDGRDHRLNRHLLTRLVAALLTGLVTGDPATDDPTP